MGVTDWEPRALPSEARCRVWAGLGGVFLACDEQGGVATMPAPAGPREYVFAVACGEGGIRVRPWLKGEPAGWNASFYPMTHPPIPEGWEKVGEWYACGVTGEKPQINDGVYTSGDGYAVPLRRILPAIPAGWEAVGEWRYEPDASCYSYTGVARDFRGEYKTIHSDGWWLLVRRVLPAVPQGWEAVGEWEHRADGDTVMFGSTTDGEMLLHESGSIEAIRPSAGWFRRVRRILPPADWGDVPRGVELNPDKGAVMLVTSDGQAVTHGIVWFAQGVWRSAKTRDHDEQRAASLPAAIVALTGRRDE